MGLARSRAAAVFLSGWRHELWQGAPVHHPAGLRETLPHAAPMLEEAKARLVRQAPTLLGEQMLDFTEKPSKSL